LLGKNKRGVHMGIIAQKVAESGIHSNQAPKREIPPVERNLIRDALGGGLGNGNGQKGISAATSGKLLDGATLAEENGKIERNGGKSKWRTVTNAGRDYCGGGCYPTVIE
jgi:hypothetical protein